MASVLLTDSTDSLKAYRLEAYVKVVRALILTLAGGLAIATSAQADPFSLVGALTPGQIPLTGTVNNFIGPGFFSGPQIGGYFGSQVMVSVPTGATVLFEFFGAEALFHNEFNFFGSELFDHPGGTVLAPNLGAPLASFQTTLFGAGLLPFTFDLNVDGVSDLPPGVLANGSNPNIVTGPPGVPNFFASCNPFSGAPGAGGTTCSTLYVFLDDFGALDADHDDFLVRISAVPEPATLSLLGLGVLGFAGRRARARRNIPLS